MVLKEYKILIGYDLFSETTLYLILYLFHGKTGSMYIVHIPKHIIWHTQTFLLSLVGLFFATLFLCKLTKLKGNAKAVHINIDWHEL